jgi:hypothetical protein
MNDSLTALAQLLGTGTVAAILLKLIERFFARADTRDTLAVGLRAEMIRRLETLEQQVGEQDARLEAMRQENTRLLIRVGQAEIRERWVRNRYHRLVNWMQSEPSFPQPPAYLLEDVPGGSETTS